MEYKQHSEGSIISKLRRYFQNGYTYRIDNAFIFSYDWESDFFCMNRDGWVFEFEVKVSKSDFKSDLKKNKHQFFSKGINETEKKFIPNRFYYAVPAGLVTKEEVPEYAGLIWVSDRATIIKRAPFIHRRKLEVRKILCDKFYNRWMDEKRRNNLLEHDYKRLLEKTKQITAREQKPA